MPPNDESNSGSDQPLGARFMTVSDPSSAEGRVQSVLESGDLPLPLVSPSAYEIEPATVNTGEQQRLLRRGAGRQVEGLRTAIEQQNQRAKQARQQAILNLAGPTAFKAITGANVDTGLEERLRLQREAEQRAAEMEQEAAQQIPQIQTEANLQAEELETKTERQNQEAENQAKAREIEGLESFASGVTDRSSRLLEARKESGSSGASSGGSVDIKDVGDAFEFARNNPNASGRAIRQVAQMGGPGVTAGDLKRVQEDQQAPKNLATDPNQVVDGLRQTKKQIGRLEKQAQSTGLTPDQQDQLQSLREERNQQSKVLEKSLANRISDVSRGLSEGEIIGPSTLDPVLQAVNTAQAEGLTTISVQGNTLDLSEVANNLVLAKRRLRQQQRDREPTGVPQPRQSGGAGSSSSQSAAQRLRSFAEGGPPSGQSRSGETTASGSDSSGPANTGSDNSGTTASGSISRRSSTDRSTARANGSPDQGGRASGEDPLLSRAESVKGRLGEQGQTLLRDIQKLQQVNNPDLLAGDLEEKRSQLRSRVDQAERAASVAQNRQDTRERETQKKVEELKQEIRRKEQAVRSGREDLQNAGSAMSERNRVLLRNRVERFERELPELRSRLRQIQSGGGMTASVN